MSTKYHYCIKFKSFCQESSSDITPFYFSTNHAYFILKLALVFVNSVSILMASL